MSWEYHINFSKLAQKEKDVLNKLMEQKNFEMDTKFLFINTTMNPQLSFDMERRKSSFAIMVSGQNTELDFVKACIIIAGL